MATIVLDTSALLKSLKFVMELADKAHKNDTQLLLPRETMRELDRIKDREKMNALGISARKAIAWMNKLLTNQFGGYQTLRGQKVHETLVPKSQKLRADDSILDCAMYSQEVGGRTTVLLSNDVNLLNRALIENVETLQTSGYTVDQAFRGIQSRLQEIMDVESESQSEVTSNDKEEGKRMEPVISSNEEYSWTSRKPNQQNAEHRLSENKIRAAKGRSGKTRKAEGQKNQTEDVMMEKNRFDRSEIEVCNVSYEYDDFMDVELDAPTPFYDIIRQGSEETTEETFSFLQEQTLPISNVVPTQEPTLPLESKHDLRRATNANCGTGTELKSEVPPPLEGLSMQDEIMQNIAYLLDWHAHQNFTDEELRDLSYYPPQSSKDFAQILKRFGFSFDAELPMKVVDRFERLTDDGRVSKLLVKAHVDLMYRLARQDPRYKTLLYKYHQDFMMD